MFRAIFQTNHNSLISFMVIAAVCVGALLGLVFKDWSMGVIILFFVMMLSGVFYAELSKFFMRRLVLRYYVFYKISGTVVTVTFIMGSFLLFNPPAGALVNDAPWWATLGYLAGIIWLVSPGWQTQSLLLDAMRSGSVESGERVLAGIASPGWRVYAVIPLLLSIFAFDVPRFGVFYVGFVAIWVQMDVQSVLSNLTSRQRERLVSTEFQ